jgi:hypothetical protein
MKKFALLSAAAIFMVPAVAEADPPFPFRDPPSCPGHLTINAKNAFHDAGIQGSAIGGLGNSDGNPDNGQVNHPLGRGGLNQLFLGRDCGVGSMVPD